MAKILHCSALAECDDVLICDTKLTLHPMRQEFFNQCFALVSGLPINQSVTETKTLFEPFQLLDLALIMETDLSLPTKVFRLHALAVFDCLADRDLFTTLYHNLSTTIQQDIPPLFVTLLDGVQISMDPLSDTKEHTLAQWRRRHGILHPNHQPPLSTLESTNVVQLPTCAVCIRRIRPECISAAFDAASHGAYTKESHTTLNSDSLVTNVTNRVLNRSETLSMSTNSGGAEIVVSRTFHHDAQISSWDKETILSGVFKQLNDQLSCILNDTASIVSCRVCATYHAAQIRGKKSTIDKVTETTFTAGYQQRENVSSLSPILEGTCNICCLAENIWCCLLCGYTGCGRYSGQHAFAHFYQANHGLSLELVSGRIWDYSIDSFAHYDSSTALSWISPTLGISSHLSPRPVDADSSILPNNTYMPQNLSSTITCMSNPIITDTGDSGILTISRVGGVRVGKVLVSNDFLLEEESRLTQNLGSETRDKLSDLSRQYDQMIENQLRDQQLHFDKLLARESARALEFVYNKKRSGGVSLNSTQKNEQSSVTTYVVDVDEELRYIETLKLEISATEVLLESLTSDCRFAEHELQVSSQDVDVVSRSQKKLEDLQDCLILEESSVRDAMVAEALEYEQQIRDLQFYISTQKKLQAAELSGGSIICTTAPSQQTSHPKISKNNRRRCRK